MFALTFIFQRKPSFLDYIVSNSWLSVYITFDTPLCHTTVAVNLIALTAYYYNILTAVTIPIAHGPVFSLNDILSNWLLRIVEKRDSCHKVFISLQFV